LNALRRVDIEIKYEGYLRRQDRQIERFRRLESLVIPERFPYDAIGELRREAREKLTAVGPRTLGQAGRIAGVSPADVAVLWVHLAGRGSRPHDNSTATSAA